jgi:hypothetical protein
MPEVASQGDLMQILLKPDLREVGREEHAFHGFVRGA